MTDVGHRDGVVAGRRRRPHPAAVARIVVGGASVGAGLALVTVMALDPPVEETIRVGQTMSSPAVAPTHAAATSPATQASRTVVAAATPSPSALSPARTPTTRTRAS
jgi:acetyl esterase/lipase